MPFLQPSFSRAQFTRRRLLQGGLALGTVNLALPRRLTAGMTTWFRVEA